MAVNPELAEQMCDFLNDILTADEEGLVAAMVWGKPISDLPATMSADEFESVTSNGLVGLANKVCGQEKGERAPITVTTKQDGTVEFFSLELGPEHQHSS
jgi:hypothetical protein